MILKPDVYKKEARPMNDTALREQICDVCHKMWQLGWAGQ